MGVSEDGMEGWGYKHILSGTERGIRELIGPLEVIYNFDAWQFDDYSKYEANKFDVEARKRIYNERFPIDCKKAYDMGAKIFTLE